VLGRLELGEERKGAMGALYRRRGERGASTPIGRRGVAGSDPAVALVRVARVSGM
jgi:hypothetical protein